MSQDSAVVPAYMGKWIIPEITECRNLHCADTLNSNINQSIWSGPIYTTTLFQEVLKIVFTSVRKHLFLLKQVLACGIHVNQFWFSVQSQRLREKDLVPAFLIQKHLLRNFIYAFRKHQWNTAFLSFNYGSFHWKLLAFIQCFFDSAFLTAYRYFSYLYEGTVTWKKWRKFACHLGLPLSSIPLSSHWTQNPRNQSSNNLGLRFPV